MTALHMKQSILSSGFIFMIEYLFWDHKKPLTGGFCPLGHSLTHTVCSGVTIFKVVGEPLGISSDSLKEVCVEADENERMFIKNLLLSSFAYGQKQTSLYVVISCCQDMILVLF